MINTDNVWSDLASYGKTRLSLEVDINELEVISQLYDEARAEGVRLRITRSRDVYGDMYIYLRKTVH